MSNDIERVTKLADEMLGGRITAEGVTRYDCTADELIAFVNVLVVQKDDLLFAALHQHQGSTSTLGLAIRANLGLTPQERFTEAHCRRVNRAFGNV